MSPIWALMLVATSGCPDSHVAIPQAAVVEQLAPAVQTGTLLFSQGDCLAVKCFSASRFTHVGMVAQTPSGPMVYDSMNGTGVRRTPLAEYVALQTPCDLLAVHPAKPIPEPQARKLCEALEQQLGRPYGIRHHLTGSKCEGVHCSEYATECLIAADLMTAKNPARVSPGSLLQGVRRRGSTSMAPSSRWPSPRSRNPSTKPGASGAGAARKPAFSARACRCAAGSCAGEERTSATARSQCG